jgi:formamidopyrimidine-DNA glycosylase
LPELPDITVYVERISALVCGQVVDGLRIGNPFVLRTVEPAPAELVGRALVSTERIGKRIVLGFEGDCFAVIHLMIAGRLHWRQPEAKLHRRQGLCAFDYPHGSLVLTEAGTKRRASLHLVSGRDALKAFDRGGVNVLRSTPEEFAVALRSRNRTLKRALTDPVITDGIGNTYSDEILHRARFSPFKLTETLTDEDISRLHQAAVDVLTEWIDRLRAETGSGFPEKVTAFRPEMAVHGRYGQPCPACGARIQRIVYTENESNYCPVCQTEGRVLADRALSRLLKEDWPRTLDELERLSKGTDTWRF